jgi:hypothetical protein
MTVKKYALMAVLATTALASKAQFLQAGLKAGANIFKIDGKSFKDEFKFGYHAGAFVQLKLADRWQLQPELMWNQYSTDAKTDTSLTSLYKFSNLKDVKLNYLSIPVLLNYSPTKLVSFQVGPQFGVLIDKNKSLLANGKAAFKGGDLSMLAGLQLNIGSVRVGGRYAIGLSNINDIDNKDKWKNQGFQLSVGMRIL